jgi:HSP20 family molecular chaperone IbpA
MTTEDKVQKTQADADDQELVREEDAPVASPAVVIRETHEAFILTADMPGVDETTTDVTIEDDVLTIEGRARHEAPEEHDLVSQEFEPLRYRRSFDVSEQIDGENVKARVRNGILEVTLPKQERARTRRVSIQVE